MLTPQLEATDQQGFSILNDFYTTGEVDALLDLLHTASPEKATFRKSADLFAIRQFLKEIPAAGFIIFNQSLRSLLQAYFGGHCFVVKSIYFDKPPTSNWHVPYHQDLTISVDKKHPLPGFDGWTVKENQFAVQPPLPFLASMLTVRIHLDPTDEQNGALHVIPASHRHGIYRPESIDWSVEQEQSCPVARGGIMLMKPLLLHSSHKTTNQKQRRVIHIEFSTLELPQELTWSERFNVYE